MRRAQMDDEEEGEKFKPHMRGDEPSNSFKSYQEKKNKGRN